MARIGILVFIVAVNAVLSSQPDEIYEYGTKIGPSHNYYHYGPETYWISGHKNGRSSWLWINGDYIVISGWVPHDTSDPAKDHCLSIAGGELKGRRCEMQTGSGIICEERETLEESLNERSIYRWKQAEHYWTSAHKIGRSTWLWINGEIMIYDDWANGQPDSLETYRCMFLSGGDWYNYECEQSIMKAFICESLETPENSTVKATYYRHSSSNTWTSGHKIGRTTYLWINGEYIQFADWARGEPSEPKTQSCLRLTANDWYDYGSQ
ncbi:hypothetical protein B566_EDAN015337 [Ephemera danica]|nr:hypothetical protein B566_EDAN015337 [Ephemera danica]